MATLHQVKLSLNDDYYIHIGAIISRWATLEYQFQNIIWAALELDNKKGRVLTIGMGCKSLLGIISNLPRKWIKSKETKSKVKNLVSGARKYVEFRNYLAHAVWTLDPNDETQTPQLNYMREGEHRILPRAQPFTPEQLYLVAKAIGELNLLADSLIRDIRNEQIP